MEIKNLLESADVAKRSVAQEALMKAQHRLFTEHGILISYFSFLIGTETRFRFYFTEIKTRYLHNPMENNPENQKSQYPSFGNFYLGLAQQIIAAEEYLKIKVLT